VVTKSDARVRDCRRLAGLARAGWVATLTALALLGVSCGEPIGPAASTSTPASTSADSATPGADESSSASSISPEYDLFVPGRAREVVDALTAAANGRPVVRLVLDRTQARLTYVDQGDRPQSFVWSAGEITPSDDGNDLVAAASFDPSGFDLDDVVSLFDQAEQISGSSGKQELQISEYDHGQTLITITTTPESTTVFFTAQGDLIPRLDLKDEDDLAQGLADVMLDRLFVVAIGVKDADQIWADVVASPGVMERRIRGSKVPMYLSQRHETTSAHQFDPSVIDMSVLARLVRTAPGILGKPSADQVTITVQQPKDASEPRIYIDVDGDQLVTDLQGSPVSES